MRNPLLRTFRLRTLSPLLAAMLLVLGCSSAREHVPARPEWLALPDAPARPGWLAAPSLPSWRDLPLVSRLARGRGEIWGTVGGRESRRTSPQGDRVVVYLEPIEAARADRAATATATIHQRDQRFSPDFLAVSAGQSVRFFNEDEIYHRIFSYSDANPFDTELLKRRESAEVTLEKPGEVHFYCTLHPAESGTLFVTPSPWFATAEATGTYRIGDVPPGQYRLRAWSQAGSPESREVTVRAGASAPVDLAISAN